MAHSRRHRKSRSHKKHRKSTKKCEPGYVAVRGRKSRSRKGKRGSPHCRLNSPRTPFVCSPGQIKIKGHKSRSAKKRSFRVKRHCRNAKGGASMVESLSL